MCSSQYLWSHGLSRQWGSDLVEKQSCVDIGASKLVIMLKLHMAPASDHLSSSTEALQLHIRGHRYMQCHTGNGSRADQCITSELGTSACI